MRAVFVDPKLKPIVGQVKMEVHDPNQNLIAQWTNQTLNTGVISQEIQVCSNFLKPNVNFSAVFNFY
jgi:hypothetical protein